MGLNRGSGVHKGHRAGDVTRKKSATMTSFSLLILNPVNCSQDINLDVKDNSQMNCVHHVFVHAFSTDILLHLKQFPLLYITKYGRISEMLFMPETSLVIRSKSLNFYALVCCLLESGPSFSQSFPPCWRDFWEAVRKPVLPKRHRQSKNWGRAQNWCF